MHGHLVIKNKKCCDITTGCGVGFSGEEAVEFLEVGKLFPVDSDFTSFAGGNGISHVPHSSMISAHEPSSVTVMKGNMVSGSPVIIDAPKRAT